MKYKLKYNILIYYMDGILENEIPEGSELIPKLINEDGTKAIVEGDIVYLRDERINTGDSGQRNYKFWKGKVKYLDHAGTIYSITYEDTSIDRMSKRSFSQKDIDTRAPKEKVTIYKIPAPVGGGTKRKRRRNKKSKRRYKSKRR